MAMNILANEGGGVMAPTDTLANLTEIQLYQLSQRILNRSLEKVKSMFAASVESGDTKHITTGQAVYDAIRNESAKLTAELTASATDYTNSRIEYIANIVSAINNWKYETLTGALPANPDPTTIYLQRDDEDDRTYVMYVYSKGRWIVIGDTSIDLVNYWKKDDIEGLTESLVNSQSFLLNIFALDKDKECGLGGDPNSAMTVTLSSGIVVNGNTNAEGKATLALPTGGPYEFVHRVDGANTTERLYVSDGNTPFKLKVDPDTRVTASLEDGSIVTTVADSRGRASIDFPKDGSWSLTTTEGGLDASLRVLVVGKGTPTNFDNRYAKIEDLKDLEELLDVSENFMDLSDKNTYLDIFGLLQNNNGTAMASTGLTNREADEIKASAQQAIDDLGYLKTKQLADLLSITIAPPYNLTSTIVQAAILNIVNGSGEVANLTSANIAALKSRLNLDDLGDTYLTLDDFKNLLGMSSISQLNPTTFAKSLMDVINSNEEMATQITDSRFNELLRSKFDAVA